ncbi:MAG: hypothetical protein ABL933_17325 [Methyloglobulus sp.]|nr:hypothetical protein [Methyloglobulus sp.]
MDEYIPYLKAKQILTARLGASPDEIASWVAFGGLNAYEKHGNRLQPFSYQNPKHYGDGNYIRLLLGLYFLINEVGRFEPTKRYIARAALIDRWQRRYPDVDTIDFIVQQRQLPEFHPIAGFADVGDGGKWAQGMFDMADVERIESESPPASVEPEKPGRLDETKSEIDPNLSKLGKQQQAILLVIAIKGFDPMKIPDGEKGTIRAICEGEYPKIFDGNTSFDRAWDEGKNAKPPLWRMEHHESYARRGKK